MKVCSVCQRCYEDNVFSCIEENHHSFNDERPGNREIITGFRLDFLVKFDAASKTYKATNLRLNQPCIIKIITVSSADEQKLNRQFLNEAQLIADINHPNLVCVEQAGVLASGEFYIVTEDIGGQTLRDFLKNIGSPSEITAVQIARQTAEGLEAIHTAGVTHRNINPENIILTSDLEHRLLVKIQNFDFGGINQQITISDISNSEHKLNYLRYFSPEQCNEQTVDSLTDIYSLGIVLYEMLSGEPPFDAPDSDGLIHKQTKMSPPEIKISNFDIRALLNYTLMDSLQKIPRLRLKKATAFARQLRHIEQLATHSSTPPPATSPAHLTNRVAVQPKIEPVESSTIANFIQVNDEPILVAPKTTAAAVSFVTNKLPPLPLPEFEEITIEKRLSSEPQSIFIERAEGNEAPPVPNLLMVEWEQPEDIPSEPETVEARKQEFGDSEFTSSLFIDEEPLIVNRESPSRIEVVMETDETEPERAGAVSMLSQYVGSSRYFPVLNQIPLIGAGLVILIVFVVGGVLINEGSEASQPKQTTAKAPPTEKILPKPAEPDVPLKEEIVLTEKSKETESKDKTMIKDESDVSDSKVSDVKKRSNLPASTSKRTEQNEMFKEKADNKTKKDELNSKVKSSGKEVTKQKVVLDKKGKETQPPPSTKKEAFTRPRIVKVIRP